jgi:hypothetical protein
VIEVDDLNAQIYHPDMRLAAKRSVCSFLKKCSDWIALAIKHVHDIAKGEKYDQLSHR